jgi:hypothetical protein
MALRRYTTVVDCVDVPALARWWAEVLGWRATFEADDEVVLVPPHASPELLARTPREQVPPGSVFVPVSEPKTVNNRLHLDLGPHSSDDRDAEVTRLLALGATPVDVGQSGAATWDVLDDPERDEFCVLSARDR